MYHTSCFFYANKNKYPICENDLIRITLLFHFNNSALVYLSHLLMALIIELLLVAIELR